MIKISLNAARRIFAISKKEFKQFYRDRLLLFAYFFLPVALVIILGYALNFDLYGIRVGVLDKDHSFESRKLIDAFNHSEYFTLISVIPNNSEIDKFIDENRIRCVVIIPQDFARKINSNKDVNIQLLIDGTEGSIATAAANYLRSAVLTYANSISEGRLYKAGGRTIPGIDLRTLFLYNSGLRSTRFFVPGLIAIILTIIAVVSISMSVANEKETGTIDHLRISWASFVEVIAGKTLMYTGVIYFTFLIILAASYLFFGIYVKGSYLLLAFSTMIFLFSVLNLGLFVSTIANTRQVAFQFATFISLSPSIILSGFIFPIENMPPAIKILSNMTPARFYITVLRNILIKGTGIEAFWPQLLSLLLFGLVFFILSVALNLQRKD